jgi:Glucose-6-phosphate dehydrogenase subunit C-terminal domain/Glucose-6-phosphate dehydrogenase subunit N-terminal domain
VPAVSDAVWSERDTTPDAIAAALRELLIERHGENAGYVPARVLNMIAFVEHAWSGEIANRLRGVGRYHASRTVVLSHEPRREHLDAVVSIASDVDPRPGEVTPLRETVIVEIGDRHLDDLPTIADPLVVTDLPTLLWSPHGHHEALDALLALGQAALIDSIEEPVWREAIDRASRLSDDVYVVDLAWLRSIPWRERIAGTFDPRSRRAELGSLCSVAVRHHEASTVAAMLLVGWLASRLGWQLERSEIDGHGNDGMLAGSAHPSAVWADGGGVESDIALRLEVDPAMPVPGLAGVELRSSSGLCVRLDRGAGGLRAHRRDPDGSERAWTVLGASRGEGGILGEGIRQALLRDPTYTPALRAASALLP